MSGGTFFFGRFRFFVYPASGGRASHSGGLFSEGTYGYAWSSSAALATHVNGSYLNFNSSYAGPETGGDRAYAFPVRCVQE